MNEWELASCFKLLHSYFEGYTSLIADFILQKTLIKLTSLPILLFKLVNG